MSGKTKGNSFERDICKSLSKWVTEGKRTDVFWRSAISGGRSTIAAKKGELLHRQAGDICAISPEGHALTDRFYFELKHYRSLELHRALLGAGTLINFWLDTSKKASLYERSPILIARQNHFPILLLANYMPIRTYSKLILGLSTACVYLFEDLLSEPYKMIIGAQPK